MTVTENDLNGPQWLADYLGLPLATVYAMNHKGTGPRRIKVGKHIRYRRGDVDAWLEANAVDTEASA